MNRIAVLLTCFNRKEKTLSCLSSLFAALPDCDVYLVDDGSTDGTSELIRQQFSQVNLIRGDGSLFWSRGMHLAWQTAIKAKAYDYYLWLNDDVVLYSYFWDELTSSLSEANGDSLVVGAIESEDRTTILYGGVDTARKRLTPSGRVQDLYLINGNVVLVPKDIVDRVGIIDPRYHHDLGDLDFGLRVRESGSRVVMTRNAVAYGFENKISRFRKFNVSLSDRFGRLYSPLGANPIIHYYFYRKHFGFLRASARFLFLHFVNLIPDRFYNFIFNSKS